MTQCTQLLRQFVSVKVYYCCEVGTTGSTKILSLHTLHFTALERWPSLHILVGKCDTQSESNYQTAACEILDNSLTYTLTSSFTEAVKLYEYNSKKLSEYTIKRSIKLYTDWELVCRLAVLIYLSRLGP